jgi:hypothetical protein
MSEQSAPRANLVTRGHTALVGVLAEENGEEVVRYFAGDVPEHGESDDDVAEALALAGAWSDLDWEEMADALDRIRHESLPTPPIEL